MPESAAEIADGTGRNALDEGHDSHAPDWVAHRIGHDALDLRISLRIQHQVDVLDTRTNLATGSGKEAGIVDANHVDASRQIPEGKVAARPSDS